MRFLSIPQRLIANPRVIPLVAYLAGLPLLVRADVGPRSCNQVVVILEKIANFGGGILLAVAVVVFLIGAYFLLFGAGSEGAATKGKQFIGYGVAGVVVGILAFSLPFLIKTILNIDIPPCI